MTVQSFLNRPCINEVKLYIPCTLTDI